MEQSDHEDGNVVEFDEKLPPIDGGAAAWMAVFVAWILEALLWGFVLSFGVFQEYYSKHELFRENERHIPIIGPLIAGIAHLGFPAISPIALRYPQYQIHLVWLGCGLCILSIVLTSFASNVSHLILAQGVLFGVGWLICYVPFLLILNEWWVAKRGFIYGIVYGASGVGGLIIPYLLSASLQRFDFRTTLRLTAGIITAVIFPVLLLLRSRRPNSAASTPSKPNPVSSRRTISPFRNRVFLIFAVATFLQGVCFYIPRFFLPQYAHSAGLSKQDSASLLAIWALCQVVGQTSLGALADHVSIFVPASLSTGISALAALLLLGPAKGFGRLAAFAGLYGGFAGAYSVLWGRTTMALGRDKEEATMMFAVFSVERGLGTLLGGPVSAALLGREVDTGAFGLGKYSMNVWFVVGTMAVATMTALGWFWREGVGEREYEAVKGEERGEGELEDFDNGEGEESDGDEAPELHG